MILFTQDHVILKEQRHELEQKKAEKTYQEVLWLDVSVHDAEAMKIPEGIGQVVHHCTAVSLSVLG